MHSRIRKYALAILVLGPCLLAWQAGGAQGDKHQSSKPPQKSRQSKPPQKSGLSKPQARPPAPPAQKAQPKPIELPAVTLDLVDFTDKTLSLEWEARPATIMDDSVKYQPWLGRTEDGKVVPVFEFPFYISARSIGMEAPYKLEDLLAGYKVQSEREVTFTFKQNTRGMGVAECHSPQWSAQELEKIARQLEPDPMILFPRFTPRSLTVKIRSGEVNTKYANNDELAQSGGHDSAALMLLTQMRFPSGRALIEEAKLSALWKTYPIRQDVNEPQVWQDSIRARMDAIRVLVNEALASWDESLWEAMEPAINLPPETLGVPQGNPNALEKIDYAEDPMRYFARNGVPCHERLFAKRVKEAQGANGVGVPEARKQVAYLNRVLLDRIFCKEWSMKYFRQNKALVVFMLGQARTEGVVNTPFMTDVMTKLTSGQMLMPTRLLQTTYSYE